METNRIDTNLEYVRLVVESPSMTTEDKLRAIANAAVEAFQKLSYSISKKENGNVKGVSSRGTIFGIPVSFWCGAVEAENGKLYGKASEMANRKGRRRSNKPTETKKPEEA